MSLNQQTICKVGLKDIEGKKRILLNEVEMLVAQ